MKIYEISVKQLVKDLYLDREDLLERPDRLHYVEAINSEAALDEFHHTVPIACLDHYEIEVLNED